MNNEIFDKIKEIAGENASDYNKRFIESQQRIAIEMAKKWQHDNPFITDKEQDSEEYKAELEKAKKNKGELVFMNGGYTYLPDSSTINYYNGLISEWQSLNNDFKTAKKQWEKQKSSYVKKQKEYEKQLKKYKNLLK